MSKEGYYLRGRVTWGTTVRGRGTIFPKVVLLIYRMPQRDAQYSKKKDEKRLVEKKGMKRKLVKTAAIRKASGASLKMIKIAHAFVSFYFPTIFLFSIQNALLNFSYAPFSKQILTNRPLYMKAMSVIDCVNLLVLLSISCRFYRRSFVSKFKIK